MAAIRRGVACAVASLTGVLGLAWLGVKTRPAPFPSVKGEPYALEKLPLPAELPAPVERFYRERYGETVPLVRTAVISGRGAMRIFGIAFPARFRFIHEAGKNYRHYFELTFFGLPVMKANEYFLDGKERMELPMGVQEDNPKLDQGGNLGMWAELLRWVPATLITDERVRWEPIDDATAVLVVPFGETTERIIVRFDPTSGDIQYQEVMRYRNGEGEKVLWINGAWYDQGRPWAVFDAEEIVHNVAVRVSVDSKGP